MGLADRLKAKLVDRIDELVAAGSAMPMKQHSRQTSYNMLSGESTYYHYNLARQPEFIEWRTSCIAVLDQAVPQRSLLRKTVDGLNALSNEPAKIEFLVGFLRSVRTELTAGSLDSMAMAIESEVLSDYLDQASAALAGSRQEPSHIAAAVIAGASLERSMRAICYSLEPPEAVVNDKGVPLGMTALIDALKRRSVFNELRAKELRTWVAIRNAAAHGQFADFNREQVEAMVAGVLRFVAEYTR